MLERVELAEAPKELLERARERSRPQRPELAAFEPAPMVRWLDPRVLLAAAKEKVVSEAFARFADKREVQGAMPARWFDLSNAGPGPLWLDFIADTGDGFDPTYTVASLAGRARLALASGEDLPRGRVLLLGGDQVYPSARREDYERKFALPYAAAFAEAGAGEEQPYMFALPGNHDWYDGLTSFLRLFCQRRWIGGRKTEQSRSYFALKLPGPWWVWAVDTQFDAYLDLPQLSYFEAVAEVLAATRGARVILATAKPSWVGAGARRPPFSQPWRTLAFLESLVEEAGANLELTLTGDRHHYCRYTSAGAGPERHKVTSGGGGAYLSATHTLPRELELPDQQRLVDPAHERGSTHRWRRTDATTYPPDEVSRRMVATVGEPPIRRHTPSFAWFTGVLYACLSLALVVGVGDRQPDLTTPLAEGLSIARALELVGDSLGVLSVTVLAAIAFGLYRFAAAGHLPAAKRPRRKASLASRHWAEHVVPVWALTLAVLALLTQPGWLTGAGFWPGWLTAATAFALGFFYAPAAFARYLRRTHERDWRGHANIVFAAQSQGPGTGHKQFVRMRVDPDGSLAGYAIAVEQVPRDWERLAEPNEEGQWFKPLDREVEPVLIDRFTIRAAPGGMRRTV